MILNMHSLKAAQTHCVAFCKKKVLLLTVPVFWQLCTLLEHISAASSWRERGASDLSQAEASLCRFFPSKMLVFQIKGGNPLYHHTAKHSRATFVQSQPFRKKIHKATCYSGNMVQDEPYHCVDKTETTWVAQCRNQDPCKTSSLFSFRSW